MFVKNSVHTEKLVRLTQQNSLVGYWKIKFLIGRTNFWKIKQKNSVSTDFFLLYRPTIYLVNKICLPTYKQRILSSQLNRFVSVSIKKIFKVLNIFQAMQTRVRAIP